MMTRVLMLGLDGATYSVLDPAFEAGHMPVLKGLLDRGASGVLTSTVPPYTPPGWTSIFTGNNPGKHGVFGFTQGNNQRPGGLIRLDMVKSPALWNAANAQGVPVGLFNIPMTYPPPPVDGFAISGMLTPEAVEDRPQHFSHPPGLDKELIEALGGYEIDIEVNYEQDWRSTAIIDRLSKNLAVKRRALEIVLGRHGDVPLLFTVLEAPDRLMHVHYKYIDPSCDHFHHPEAAAIRERVWSFFDEMDEVIGDLVAWGGPDGFVVTMSDHGFGPKDKSVNVNLALREWGLLSLGGIRAVSSSAGARRLAAKVKKYVPRSAWRRVTGPVEAGIDWSSTRAFSSPNPQQGIYVNLEGREPQGVVPAAQYEAVRGEISDRFRELTDPDDGKPVLDQMLMREEVMDGPQADGAPDLFPVCREYSYELHDGLHAPHILTDVRSLPRGFHHMDGIFGVAGPGIEARSGLRAHLYDMAPTALYLSGLKIPAMDGRVLTDYLPETMVAEHPPQIEDMELPNAGGGVVAAPYSAEEEAEIEESLRNLGYL
jgi:predicted AlkP superfamily phosphohydrolase/phosphomutase